MEKASNQVGNIPPTIQQRSRSGVSHSEANQLYTGQLVTLVIPELLGNAFLLGGGDRLWALHLQTPSNPYEYR